MLVLPRQPAPVQWHQSQPWRHFAKSIFRAVSGRRDFSIEFRRGRTVAGVIAEHRRLIINPDLLPVPGRRVRFDPGTEHGRRVRLIRALAAHEGGHVPYSAAKPEGTLGWLWNALEDERMERLVAQRFPTLHEDFVFLGDVILGERQLGGVQTLDACWLWRFTHDRPDLRLQPEDEAQWQTVRPLVEAAWVAQREDVQGIAREILDIIKQSSGKKDPQPKPQDGREAQGQQQGDQGQQGDEGQEGGQGQQQGQQDQQGQQQGQQDQTAKGERDGEGPGEAGAQEQPDPQSPDIPLGADGAGLGDEDSLGSGTPSGDQAENRPRPSRNTPEANQSDEDAGEPTSESTDLDEDDEQGTDPEDFGASEPADADGAGENAASAPLGAEDGAGGGGVSDLPGPPPDLTPGENARDFTDTLERVEGLARSLAPILAPPGRPARVAAHRSRGRYRYDREARGAERVFARKVGEDRPKAFLLRLVVDVSSSMSGRRLEAAREAALLLIRASEISLSRRTVIAFGNDADVAVPVECGPQEARERVMQLRAAGGTRLLPALTLALETRALPDEQAVTVVICDGELTGVDRAECGALLRELARRGPWVGSGRAAERPLVVPLLIGEAARLPGGWSELFGEALPVIDVEDTALTLRRTLLAVRARMQNGTL